MAVNPDPVANDGSELQQPPRRRWWQLGTSVGQTLLVMLGLTLLAIPGLVNGWSKLYVWLQLVFVLVYVGMLLCGVATVGTLRRHPEMRHATPQLRPVERSTRRRYAVATLIGAVLALVSLVAAVLIQTPAAWVTFVVIGLMAFFCLMQLGRPLVG